MSVTSRQHALQFGSQKIHTSQARFGESAFRRDAGAEGNQESAETFACAGT